MASPNRLDGGYSNEGGMGGFGGGRGGGMSIYVSHAAVGIVIGKCGRMIKKIQQDTGAKVQFNQYDRQSKYRVCSIRGQPDQVQAAQEMIQDLLNNSFTRQQGMPSRQFNTSEGGMGGFGGGRVGGMSISVPRAACGIVIGKGREMIKKIKQDTGAKVQFNQYDRQSKYRVFSIRGPPDKVQAAQEMIQDLLNNFFLDAGEPVFFVDDHGNKNKPGRKEDISSDICLDEGEESSKNSSTPTTDQTCKEKATEWKQVYDFGIKHRPEREEDKRFDANLDAGTYLAFKKGSTHSTDQTGSDKATQWTQDVNAWRMCIERSDKKEAERLICEKILPDQEMLNKASTSFRSDLQVLKIIGDQISSYIKAESNKIINVYAGYKHAGHELVEENALVFAVITTSKIDVENKFGYKLEQICVHKVNSSQEDKDIALMERKYPMNEEDIIKAEKVVAFNSQELVKKHKNITRISVSWIKSSRYGTDNASMDREVCISLYVPKKGLIPIDEKSFPDTLDGFPVDVREGVYIPYSDVHDNIKIGCKISGHSTGGEFGTLGGFFEKEEKVYGITCAHVFLQNQMFRLGLEKNHGTWEAPQTETEDPSNYVYQPSQYKHKRPFGSLVQAVVTAGCENTSGVDAAVFNIENRHPNSGEFPDANNGRNAGFEETPMLFNSGNLSETVNLNASVVKHGCATDMTRGIVRSRASTAILYIHPDWGCRFYNQYEVTTSDNTNFATNGDSGAMVFTVENNELTGIGIVEGGGGSVCFVTPIYDVFRALNMTNPPYEMKRFV